MIRSLAHHPRASRLAACLAGMMVLAAFCALSVPNARAADPPAGLHAPFDTLLSRYLARGEKVHYLRWWAADADRQRLTRYIDTLEGMTPSAWSEADAKTYWINLYNAALFEVVLEAYPVDNIKQIGGVLGSPWGKKALYVEGREMSLEVIEHDVLRKRYADARVHLVLHNASRGGPPLRERAFRADSLDVQLDEAVRRYVNDSRFVQVLGKELVLAKVFDWRKDAFQKDAGSIEAFLARYRDDVVPGEKNKYRYRFLDYDWTLNEAR